MRTCRTFDLAVRTGTWKDTQWKKLAVGQLLRVDDNELFPADLLCLKSNLTDGVCFIRTTNLDGETNLKVRRYHVNPESRMPSEPFTVEP